MRVILTENGYVKIYDDGRSESSLGSHLQDSEVVVWVADGNLPEPHVEPEQTYSDLRAAEYPSIAEQMDMQYWDGINGTDVWRNTIQAVKDKYPKPEA